MSFTREQANDLDRWITREDIEELWCKACDCDSNDCEFPDDHADEWITREAHGREDFYDQADDAYDAYIDKLADR